VGLGSIPVSRLDGSKSTARVRDCGGRSAANSEGAGKAEDTYHSEVRIELSGRDAHGLREVVQKNMKEQG